MTEESRNAIYHRCRWCRYFHNGCCSKLSEEFGNPTAKTFANINYALGDGVLAEPMQEVFEDARSNFSNELQENDTKWQNFLEEIIENLEVAVKTQFCLTKYQVVILNLKTTILNSTASTLNKR